MASIRSLVSAAAATVGPDARNASRSSSKTAKIVVPSAQEDNIVKISQLDSALFQTFGKDSPVIPAGSNPCHQIFHTLENLI